MNLHLAVLSVYSLGLMALGLWIGRRVRGTTDRTQIGRKRVAHSNCSGPAGQFIRGAVALGEPLGGLLKLFGK